MEIREVESKSILAKIEIQQRASLNQDYIDELSETIANGAILPPIDVYNVSGELLLADGFHRLEAHMKAGIDRVKVNIIAGTKRDALLHAVGANGKHGLRRKNEDKRRAVMTLLTDDEWGKWSDCEVARKAQVSPPFVSKMKRELTEKGAEFSPARKCADGRVINTSKIGARPSDDTVTVEGGGPEILESEVSEIPIDETTEESASQSAESGSTSTDNLLEMIKGYVPEGAKIASASITDQESDDQGHETEAIESSAASEADDEQSSTEESPEAADVQPVADKISELEKIIEEKDLQISKLEAENEKLQARIQELEAQAEYQE